MLATVAAEVNGKVENSWNADRYLRKCPFFQDGLRLFSGSRLLPDILTVTGIHQLLEEKIQINQCS